MPEPTHAVYVISVAAELAGVHPQTLRIYERKGLLEPARTGGGSRRYSSADIDLLRRIQELTNDGLNLVGVQRILDLESQLAARSAEVDALRAELETVRAQSVRAVREAQQEHRRDLVPLNQELLLYRRPRAR